MFLEPIKDYFTPQSILDIGANTGWFYDLASKIFPDAYFFLIEANPACEEGYKKNYKVDYHIGPLSNSIKTVEFYTTKSDPWTTGASIYKENTDHFSDDNTVVNRYETTTLDLLFVDKQFDLIKMDVQGSELDILRGGTQIVSRAKGLLIELSLIEYNQNAPLQTEVIEYLNSIGFVEEEELACSYAYDYSVIQRDALFINTNI